MKYRKNYSYQLLYYDITIKMICLTILSKYAAGPEDFLAYIDHAALVLSSSFHGTAFSLIYS
ncbi:hypothetical protein DWV67_16255 [Dorea formicigenerans]|uniref:Polysaccharide pyruvyl transferase domain-containing protein n=1 Tax=Dorea formicigenerans TaxID=39486 RepID=A0A395XKQ8_9FIRM|nr:hypothetical protein DWV67_16255 [Dorea formicigenerans]